MWRAIRAAAFAYDFVSVVAVLLLGGAALAVGVVKGNAGVVVLGVVLTLAGAAWMAFDVWPSRRGE